MLMSLSDVGLWSVDVGSASPGDTVISEVEGTGLSSGVDKCCVTFAAVDRLAAGVEGSKLKVELLAIGSVADVMARYPDVVSAPLLDKALVD